MKGTSETMTEVLRRAIVESGEAHIALERATGVKRASIMRFVRGTTSLRLDLADRLATHLGLEVRQKRKGR
jgi:plasmid maintenance system antidote protein VapI